MIYYHMNDYNTSRIQTSSQDMLPGVMTFIHPPFYKTYTSNKTHSLSFRNRCTERSKRARRAERNDKTECKSLYLYKRKNKKN